MNNFPLNEFTLPENNEDVVRKTWGALGRWRSFIIALDGRSFLGKSVYGRYLAYRLNAPLLHLDLFKDRNGVLSHSPCLSQLLMRCYDKQCPVVVEGVCAAQALDAIGFNTNWLIRLSYLNYLGPRPQRTECERYEAEYAPDILAKASRTENDLDEDFFERAQKC